MKKFLIGLMLLGILGAGAGIFYALGLRSASIPWTKDLTEARRISKSSGKPLLLYLFTDWCGYCKRMEETTLRDPLITREMAPRYVWVRLNAETDPAGDLLRSELGVTGYPTIVIYDPDGDEVDRTEGYQTAAKLKEVVEFFLASPTSFGTLKRAAAQQPNSLEAQYALAEKYLERGDYFEAGKRFAMVIGHDPDNQRTLTDASYYFLAFALASGGQPEEALNQIRTLTEKFPESRFLADAAVLRGQILYYAGQNREALAVLEDYLARFPEHSNRHWASQLAREIKAETPPPPPTSQ